MPRSFHLPKIRVVCDLSHTNTPLLPSLCCQMIKINYAYKQPGNTANGTHKINNIKYIHASQSVDSQKEWQKKYKEHRIKRNFQAKNYRENDRRTSQLINFHFFFHSRLVRNEVILIEIPSDIWFCCYFFFLLLSLYIHYGTI